MKELSIKEKAIRYDEVVERAKIEKEESRNLGLLEFIDENFPELKESEDERIKEVLIDYFNRYKEQEGCGVKTFYGIPTDNILVWLKSIKPKTTWKPSDEQMVQLSKYCPDNIALTSLYEHLKKLIKE